MVWGQTNPMILLIILHGVVCDSKYDSKCNSAACGCGEAVTITCTLTHPLLAITLQHGNRTLLSMNITTNENPSTKNEDVSIDYDYTKGKVELTISSFKFTDILKYELFLTTTSGIDPEPITVDVHGICDPEITENNETNIFECEAESEKNASIIWRDNHRKIYEPARPWTSKQLNNGFKLWTSLKWTEEMGDNLICCSVSYKEDSGYKEKESCIPNTSAITNKLLGSKSPTIHVVIILLAVALAAAVLVYLLKRRNGNPMRARSLSQGPLMGQEPHEEQDTTEPSLVQPQSV